ncbi:hypothetical protein SD961_12455 [Erwinia sp. MMLR14_017]|uniref:hypothetical protein n=1 Tax=Erwinia sp. MMLR14_017 TaxID=3093842 RepID=UPI0029900385|nr:hypothetical protein [Erwinia sp. MMLR14_017]MDW8846690.1 hypothetical protein [Erwinia sp. MMLR14_017]
MTDNVSLTIKIDPALKETLKSLALENQISLSQEVCQRLQESLTTPQPSVLDNQSSEEEEVGQLNASELKQIRALLKKSKKKK